MRCWLAEKAFKRVVTPMVQFVGKLHGIACANVYLPTTNHSSQAAQRARKGTTQRVRVRSICGCGPLFLFFM